MSCPYDGKPCKIPMIANLIIEYTEGSFDTKPKNYLGDKVGCMICSNHKIVRELSILRATK